MMWSNQLTNNFERMTQHVTHVVIHTLYTCNSKNSGGIYPDKYRSPLMIFVVVRQKYKKYRCIVDVIFHFKGHEIKEWKVILMFKQTIYFTHSQKSSVKKFLKLKHNSVDLNEKFIIDIRLNSNVKNNILFISY